jgi:bifunctional DNase/RNase
MIEMLVRTVRKCPRTGKPVAILEPRARGAGPRLALTMPKPEAHALLHELHAQETLRGQAFALLGQVLDGLHARLAAVEIVPADDGAAVARLQLDDAQGTVRLPLTVGQGLGIAVSQRVPLLVAEAILATHAYQDGAAALDDTPDGTTQVPDAFLRAFEE